MKKRLKLIPLALVMIALAYGFIAEGAQAAQNQPLKDLQVLKGLSPDQVLLLMGKYNLALGRNCDYCHDMKALDKGEKPEHKKALEMIKMTRDINAAIKNTYKMSVDCMSCHQGKAKPSAATSEDVVDPPPPTPLPEIIRFRAIALGANQVVFPHAKHTGGLDCAKCHHAGGEPGKCTPCHKHNSGDAGLAFKPISHSIKSDRACTGCHLQMKVGPTKCDQCHKR
jgi:class III cytochrome C family protein/photosynthetic reaction center cytochrome c subunit